MKCMKQTKVLVLSFMALSIYCMGAGQAVEASVEGNMSWDPGTQLNQTRTYLEQQQRLAQLQADKKNKMSAVETAITKEEQKTSAGLTFELKSIDFDPSVVLGQNELSKLAQPYLNKQINIDALYELVYKVNALYKEKGYVVCRASLQPQTIHAGHVHIKLVEGKTGTVTVAGNKNTRDSYIKKRLPLKPDEVSNLKQLSDSVLWFNGTNDVQLRIKLKAGEKNGTTDYEITAYEPQHQHGYVLFDTAGSESTGIWREGLGWYTRSLTGNRDNLNLYLMRSDGTKSGSVNYSIPIFHSGTRFGVQYSANSIAVKHGALADLDVTGHSNLYSFALTQPLKITDSSRVEAGLEWSKQHSKTDFLGMPWIDDSISRWTASLTMTNYSAENIWYQRHSYFLGKWDDINSDQKQYGKYNLDFLGQHLFANHHLFTARLTAQLSSSHYLPSADQFYIGGVNSVRGYKENILGGDNGYSLSMEYAIPTGNKAEWFGFIDMGGVYGDNAFDDHVLMGAGIGWRMHMNHGINATVALGVPFRKELNQEEQSNYRIHFSLYGEF